MYIVYQRLDEFRLVHKKLKKVFRDSKLNIVDIGANTGQSIERFQKLFNKSKIL